MSRLKTAIASTMLAAAMLHSAPTGYTDERHGMDSRLAPRVESLLRAENANTNLLIPFRKADVMRYDLNRVLSINYEAGSDGKCAWFISSNEKIETRKTPGQFYSYKSESMTVPFTIAPETRMVAAIGGIPGFANLGALVPNPGNGALTLTPPTIIFGNVVVGQSATQPVRINNTTGQPHYREHGLLLPKPWCADQLGLHHLRLGERHHSASQRLRTFQGYLYPHRSGQYRGHLHNIRVGDAAHRVVLRHRGQPAHRDAGVGPDRRH